MKKLIFAFVLFTLLFTPLSKLHAQVNDNTAAKEYTFDISSVPQWAKDLRRFDIIAFGTFPFTFLFTTIFYDMYLRNNSMSKPDDYYKRVVLMSAGASLTLALADLFIIRIKRSRGKRKIEDVDAGTYEIETQPYGEPESEE